MNDILAMFIVFIFVVLAAFGVTFIEGDYRHFKDVAKQCEQQGYIQDNQTRIICVVERG